MRSLIMTKTRKVIAAHFDAWLQLLTDAIEELKKRGVLIPSAEAHALATGLLAGVIVKSCGLVD